MAVIPETAPAPASGKPGWRRFLTPWRSPADQPAWARPALLAIAVLAAVAYGWGMAGASVEPFYGAAARSMSESWHDFIFGAFDPAGTVTVDKLPGALWMQALSLRIFGFHIWALVLPQVVEGVLTILVLYRAVRRLAGPAAGLTAAAVLAVTPITVLLSRGNVSDSLLILLLVLAADATSAALLTGALRPLLIAGVWVGLAFQAKMIQAWLALPALAAAYLLAAPAARLRTRCAHVALAGLVTVVISLSWMTAVSLVPAQDRPYVDGSANDSVYTQVFDYNGLGRLTGNWASIAGPPSPIIVARQRERSVAERPDDGHQAGLAPAAVRPVRGRRRLAAAGRPRRRAGRAHLPAPPGQARSAARRRRAVGRLVADPGGLLQRGHVPELVLRRRAGPGGGGAVRGRPGRVRAPALVGPGAADRRGDGAGLRRLRRLPDVRDGVRPLPAHRGGAGRGGGGGGPAAAARVGPGRAPDLGRVRRVAVLLLPAAASVTAVVQGLGPFDSPFESAKTAHTNQLLAAAGPAYTQAAQQLALETPPGDALFGVDTSGLAENYILYSGLEVLPIGGYLGNVPAPTLAALQSDINDGYVRFFLLPVSPSGTDPRVQWIEAQCPRQPPRPNSRPRPDANFVCSPAPAAASQPASPTQVSGPPSPEAETVISTRP